MRVSVKFGSYNARRYGRPWIGKITSWSVGGTPEIAWGSYIGDENGGECEIDAQPGDIVRAGQRDGRGRRKKTHWYIVSNDGTTLFDCTQPEARKHWDTRKTATNNPLANISDTALWAEVVRRGLQLREVSNG